MSQQCRELLKRCSAYLEGDLDGACCEEMEKHVLTCGKCRTMLEEMKWTMELCKSTPAAEVPREVHEALRARLRAERSGS
ncbi:MAG: zf-HC2 domain-containing protein [Nitrospirota bacterium]|jgi:anti-sigma factor RsiW